MDDERKDLLKPLHYFSIEKYILIIAIFMVILLIGINTSRIYTGHTMTYFSETKAFYDLEHILYNTGTITLSIHKNKEYPLLEIMVNGNVIDKFHESKQITINVTDRDIVQINGSMYKDDITVTVKNTSLNIVDHLNTKEVLVKQNIGTLAIIKM